MPEKKGTGEIGVCLLTPNKATIRKKTANRKNVKPNHTLNFCRRDAEIGNRKHSKEPAKSPTSALAKEMHTGDSESSNAKDFESAGGKWRKAENRITQSLTTSSKPTIAKSFCCIRN